LKNTKKLKEKGYKVIISGGGTGGHVYPAIAIANELKQSGVEILFVGAKHKLEMIKVPQAGYKIIGLPVQGLQRRLTYKNIFVFINLIKSIFKSKKIIKNFKPDVVVGVGGYASLPILYIAFKKKIPTLLQEQNSYAGMANKFLSKKAKKICVAYHNMEKYFPKEKIVFTGNPIRKDLLDIQNKKQDAYKYFQLDQHKKTILVLGGSLGARTINESLPAMMKEIKERQDIQILWQTGKNYYDTISKNVKESNYTNLNIKAFIDKMDYAYEIADLVISRAGALTISEICFMEKPCILVPSPNVSEDHQTKNAKALVEKNAALMVKDSEAKEKLIPLTFSLIEDSKKLIDLQENIKPLSVKTASQDIAKEILKILEDES